MQKKQSPCYGVTDAAVCYSEDKQCIDVCLWLMCASVQVSVWGIGDKGQHSQNTFLLMNSLSPWTLEEKSLEVDCKDVWG